MIDPHDPFIVNCGPVTALPVERAAPHECGECLADPPRWHLDVRIRGHWAACGLHTSSAAAIDEGLRQLTLAGELSLAVRPSRCGLGYEVHEVRLQPGAASLRVTEGIPGVEEVRPSLPPAKKGVSA